MIMIQLFVEIHLFGIYSVTVQNLWIDDVR